MGDDVWLRSEEANINLGGLLDVTVGRGQKTLALAQPPTPAQPPVADPGPREVVEAA